MVTLMRLCLGMGTGYKPNIYEKAIQKEIAHPPYTLVTEASCSCCSPQNCGGFLFFALRPPLRPPSSVPSYTTHHTPLILHHSSRTSHLQPLILHHSSHATHLTTIITHQSSYTTRPTPLITHHSSYITHLSPLILHHSSGPLITHYTHHAPLI